MEYILRTVEDQMLKKVLMRQVPEPFYFFNEPLPNAGDPAASHCTGAIECTPADSSRLQLNIKRSQVCIYSGLIHCLVPMRNKLDCTVKWRWRGDRRGKCVSDNLHLIYKSACLYMYSVYMIVCVCACVPTLTSNTSL